MEIDPEDQSTEWQEYVLGMVSKLIQAEEHTSGILSGLRVYCRLDVSVFWDEIGNRHQFFTNEITRGHCSGLFSHWDKENRMMTVFKSMSKSLHFLVENRLMHVHPQHLLEFCPHPRVSHQ